MKTYSCQTPIFLKKVSDFKNAVIARGGIIKPVSGFSIMVFDEIIDQSVRLAYRDIQRIFTGINAFTNKKDAMLDYLKTELKKYFASAPKTQGEFNDWHKETCTAMMGFLAGYTRGGAAGFTYGCAQKIVNLAFKYLYCYDYFDVSDKEYMLYFIFCHITLDSITLGWTNFHHIPISSINNYGDYMDKQKTLMMQPLDAPWHTCYPLCPLEKEFIIW